MSEYQVAAVAEYGVKSCAQMLAYGEVPQTLDIGDAGVELAGWQDRLGVLGAVTHAGSREARFISARGWGPEADRTRYPGDSNLVVVQNNIVAPGELEIMAPGHDRAVADVNRANRTPDDKLWRVSIHSGTYRAVDMGLAAAEIFTNFLADQNPDEGIRDVRLFVAPQNRPGRTVRDAYQFEGASRRVNGADGAAILAVNEATLGWMQDQYHFTDEYIDILRARANLVLTGLEPMEEDFIGAVTINGRRLVNVGPSGRCVETGVDPRTGERDDNRFLKVLGQAGRKGWSASSHDPGLMFGINLQPEPSQDLTPVSVGDAFTVEWTSGSNILYEKPKGLG